MKRTLALIILDGWGIGREDETNPIHVVNPKHFQWLKENFPMTSLQASGISVGLPWGEIGNSEVGHLTLGAGRIVYQYYPRITLAIRDRSFFKNPAFISAFRHAQENRSTVHLVGLLTKANIHASFEHLQALLAMAEKEKVSVLLHLFADGKDSPPHSFETFFSQLPKERVATLVGRYYAMDRNQNWQLTKTTYDTLTGDGGTLVKDPFVPLRETYRRNFSEEFLPPLRLQEDGRIGDNDSVIFFNFREDSIEQLAEAFVIHGFDKFPIKELKNLIVVTMTHYSDKFNAPVAFPPDVVHNPLGAVLSNAGKTQLRLAETYKYAHITYFFNGYREAAMKNEYRVLIPSLSGLRIEDHPEMMAQAITDRLVQAIENQSFDFILVNYANPDSVAHTANYEAAKRAVTVIDTEIGRVLKASLTPNTLLLITSDHGHIEELLNPPTGLPESQHVPSPVPFYLVGSEFRKRKFLNWESAATETLGTLADVAPTILELMGVKKPEEMNGRSLLENLLP